MTKRICIAIAGTALLAGCNSGPPTPDKTVQQLMAQDVQPTADIYWKSVQFISDETGSHEIFPRSDAEWQRVEAAAVRIGELAELLKTPEYSQGRGKDWLQFASSLSEVSVRAAQAAKEQDREKVFDVGGVVYQVCTACHNVYPATTGPEAEEAERPG